MSVTSVPNPKFASSGSTLRANFGFGRTLETQDSSVVFGSEIPSIPGPQCWRGFLNHHTGVGGNIVTSSITNEAVKELGLKKGMIAYAVIKASDVMVAVD